jgi:formyl-CoA transferase
MANNDELQAIVEAWVAERPRDVVLADLDAHEVVAAPVNDAKDITEDPHFRERTLVDLAGTVLGKALVPGPVLHMDSYAGPVYDGVPSIGEHTESALTDLIGLPRAELEALSAASVVGPTPVPAA